MEISGALLPLFEFIQSQSFPAHPGSPTFCTRIPACPAPHACCYNDYARAVPEQSGQIPKLEMEIDLLMAIPEKELPERENFVVG
jgi:hypothetical protein